jgi:N-acyl-D-aspartate/D-glutamate deacylase
VLLPLSGDDDARTREVRIRNSVARGSPWHTFGEWLDRIDGRLGVNAGFLVGHAAMLLRSGRDTETVTVPGAST